MTLVLLQAIMAVCAMGCGINIYRIVKGSQSGRAFMRQKQNIYENLSFSWNDKRTSLHRSVLGLGNRRQHQERVMSVERHLPELSETLAMGMRAGLSFDRAFMLYHDRFDDELALLCRDAQKRWQSGFMSREDSLNKLADEGDSELLRRLVASINRSMKLGGSLTRTLEIFSSEARSCHKAKMEEKIAKVPVKMMFPITLFILPSILIVILGPVVLSMTI